MNYSEIPPHLASIAPLDVESAGFLRQLATLIPVAFYVFNHQTMSNEFANRSIAELLGYSPEEIKEMGENLLPAIIHPDDFDLLAGHVGSLQELRDEEQSIWEYRAVHRDGREVWLRSIETVYTRAASGEVLRHIGIAFDITAEKTAEFELRELRKALAQQTAEQTTEVEALTHQPEDQVSIVSSRLEAVASPGPEPLPKQARRSNG